ncbi:peptidylprolyl isomerase [Bacillus altitudinis]|uniref:peptidylprolyl isomerase n=1 Tax=Bacillus pumilus TaxID=1408 RepID=UPI0025A1E0A5|nr:peptidylprolyl isomerase [Bacillus pumilus]MDM5319351.1 peptidylprolyl isomerase [Bacillus pumilus]MDR4994007.1 peptidylprolyl isomerase [Bacillus altitudinis]
MKKMALAAVTAVSVLTLGACSSGDKDVIATTKSGDVTKEELYTTLKKQAGGDALNVLVQQKVLADKYKVSDKEIDKKMEEYKKTLGEDRLKQLQDEFGKDYIKDQVKYELLTQKAAKANIKITDKEVKAYYDDLKGKIRASHILVADKKTADEVEKKLDKGEKWDAVVSEYSTDTASAAQGGDVGWFAKKGQMDENFSKAAFKLKVNEISKPVKSQFGYHIIKKTEERGKYDDMKADLKKELLKQKQADTNEIQTILNKLVKDADVKVKDKELENTFKEKSKQPAQNQQTQQNQ